MDLDIDFFKIKHNNFAPSKGRVLVSEPFSADLFFKRSVILLTEHNKEGSVGFILNKPVEFPIEEILKDFPPFDANISIGGPVKTDTIHYVHTVGDLIPNSVKVSGNLYWGGDFDILKQLIIANKINPKEIRFFVGYSGWSPEQLSNEIQNNYWLVTELPENEIMEKPDNIWKHTLRRMDKQYKAWVNYPENPTMN